MSSLLSLSNQVLEIVCHAIYPEDVCYDRVSLKSLAALARTNKRLSSIATMIFYARGVFSHLHLPLAWGAKFGLRETLNMALAVGADPDFLFYADVDYRLWVASLRSYESHRAFQRGDKDFWPPFDRNLLTRYRERFGKATNALHPDLVDLDIIAPTNEYKLYGAYQAATPDGGFVDEDDCRDEITLATEYEERDRSIPRTFTAAHLAAREGHNEIISILVDHGVDLSIYANCPCICHPPPFAGFWFLPSEGAMGVSSPHNWSPLHVALCSGHIETAKLLLSNGAAIVPSGILSSSPGQMRPDFGILFEAAARGHADVLQHIFDFHPNIDVNCVDQTGQTALFYAFPNRRWDSTIPLLLERGADINFAVGCDVGNQHIEATCLDIACRLGRFEDALRLLDLGAKITRMSVSHLGTLLNPPPNFRVDPLQLCAIDFKEWQKPHCRLFLEEFVYFQDEDASHMVETCATRVNLIEDRTMEIQRQAQLQERFWPQLNERLIREGGLSADNILLWDPLGNSGHPTTLMLAVQSLNLPAVDALITHGKPKIGILQPHEGWSNRNALMATVAKLPQRLVFQFGGRTHRWEDLGIVPCKDWNLPLLDDYPKRFIIVKKLVGLQVPVNYQDDDGNTVLHLLFESTAVGEKFMNPRSAELILRYLLVHGASASLLLRNERGETAFECSIRNKCAYALDIIASKGLIRNLFDHFDIREVTYMFEVTATIPTLLDAPSNNKDEDDDTVVSSEEIVKISTRMAKNPPGSLLCQTFSLRAALYESYDQRW